jgi:hypothetical protein
MKWYELIEQELQGAYATIEKLLELVEPDKLEWKPATGSNWMTVGQLLMHLATSGGMAFKGFITGDWGMPEGVDPGEMAEGEMLPPAEKMPTVNSLDQARSLIAADKQLAYEQLASCTEEQLQNTPAPAPWDPRELSLGYRLLQMVNHLNSPKAQLFYYLKLQGKPVHTGHLWGM